MNRVGLALLLCAIQSFGAQQKWSWKNIKEPNCNNCNCVGTKILPLISIKSSLYSAERHILMANRLRVSFMSVTLLNGKLIKSDKHLTQIAPLTVKSQMKNKRVTSMWTSVRGSTYFMECELRKNGHSRCGDYSFSRIKLKAAIGNGTRSDTQMADSIMGDWTWNYRAVWADEKNILWTICFGDKGYSGWVLTSTSKTMSTKTKKKVLQIVVSLGFDPSKTVMFPTSWK